MIKDYTLLFDFKHPLWSLYGINREYLKDQKITSYNLNSWFWMNLILNVHDFWMCLIINGILKVVSIHVEIKFYLNLILYTKILIIP